MCDEVRDAGALDDAALNLAITGSARDEAAAAGRRLALVAELVDRRVDSEVARSRERWLCDGWDSCAAEIAADLLITHRRASGLMHQALDLRDNLPLIGALLGRGDIPFTVATTASWRTQLIEDPAIYATVDAELAAAATRWGGYSARKLGEAIDAIIERHDPDAVRRFRTAQKSLNMQFGKRDDATGTCSVFGRLSVADAAIGERRQEALASSVCPNDPRTQGERRAEAYGVVMAGGDHLPCRCERDDCPAPTGDDARGRLFEILVLTDDPDAGSRVDDDPEPLPDDGPVDPRIDDPDYDMSQHWYDDPPEDDIPPPPDDQMQDDSAAPDDSAEPESAEPDSAEPDSADSGSGAPAAQFRPRPAPEPAPTSVPCSYTTIVAGGRIVPAPLLADLRLMDASVRTVTAADELEAEARYRPSTALKRFCRARDMTCRFPGCTHPAEYGDVDHTIPYADSRLTHPGNTKVLCRKHHLLKTFWVGRGGWSDRQEPDGTVVWTAPSGLKHRAPPGCRIYFPNWNPTTPLPDGAPVATAGQTPGRELRMPTRRRTRAQQRAASIKAERKRNHEARQAECTAPF